MADNKSARLGIDGRGLWQGFNLHTPVPAPRGQMASNFVAPRFQFRVLTSPPSQWDDAGWDQDHDEAAGHRRTPAAVAIEFPVCIGSMMSSQRYDAGSPAKTLVKRLGRRDRGPWC